MSPCSNKKSINHNPEAGMTLVITLLLVLTLTVMASAVTFVVNNHSDMNTVIESILTYCFIGRFHQAGKKVRLAIDWFEGQALDKAWNMGFKNFFPKTKRIGDRPTESFPL